jgi:peptidylprolyl isomerase
MFESETDDMEGVGRFGWVTDPEGNRVELWQPGMTGWSCPETQYAARHVRRPDRGSTGSSRGITHPGRRKVRAMSASEKPDVTVPAGRPAPPQLQVEDLAVGEGDEAVPGRVVEVHYVGVSWSDGRQFDASWDRGETFTFALGKGQVIAGWDQGVDGMQVGGRRRLTIPPDLAYGKQGAGGIIGPDETLVFVVDLVGVR